MESDLSSLSLCIPFRNRKVFLKLKKDRLLPDDLFKNVAFILRYPLVKDFNCSRILCNDVNLKLKLNTVLANFRQGRIQLKI